MSKNVFFERKGPFLINQIFKSENFSQKTKIVDIKIRLKSGLPTIPSTIKDELECNIFLRSNNLETFSKLRDLKDNF